MTRQQLRDKLCASLSQIAVLTENKKQFEQARIEMNKAYIYFTMLEAKVMCK